MKTRKELQEEYKQIKPKSGIYQIRNLTNAKIFVGNSRDLTAIWHRQKMQLEAGLHKSAELQSDWTQQGAENFVYEIITEHKSSDKEGVDLQEELDTLEQMYLEELFPFDDKGYNKRKLKRNLIG